jgi:hypothetical protein
MGKFVVQHTRVGPQGGRFQDKDGNVHELPGWDEGQVVDEGEFVHPDVLNRLVAIGAVRPAHEHEAGFARVEVLPAGAQFGSVQQATAAARAEADAVRTQMRELVAQKDALARERDDFQRQAAGTKGLAEALARLEKEVADLRADKERVAEDAAKLRFESQQQHNERRAKESDEHRRRQLEGGGADVGGGGTPPAPPAPPARQQAAGPAKQEGVEGADPSKAEPGPARQQQGQQEAERQEAQSQRQEQERRRQEEAARQQQGKQRGK